MAECKLHADKTLRLALIGGGAGAREFIVRFLETHAIDCGVSITVFDTRPFGRGYAWVEETAPCLANMRVETLGPSYFDFDQIQKLLAEIEHPEATAEYPTRGAVGRALDERYARIIAKAPPHWRIGTVSQHVVDLDRRGTEAFLTTGDGHQHGPFDGVVLCMGNIPALPPSGFVGAPNYINAWNIEALAKIQPTDTVFIKGASLSSIDVTLRLEQAGHVKNRSIVWHSKSGSLPYVRPKQLKLDPVWLSVDALMARFAKKDPPTTLQSLYELFESELRAQEVKCKGQYTPGTDLRGFKAMRSRYLSASQGRHFIDFGIASASSNSLWFSVAKLFDEFVIPYAWNQLHDHEKSVFLEIYQREFDRYWAPVPVVNGIRIKQWLADDTIQLLRQKFNYTPDPTGRLALHPGLEDPLGEKLKEELAQRYAAGFDYVVDAGGIPSNLSELDSPLVQKLVEKKYLTPFSILQTNGLQHRGLGARIDWLTGAVLDRSDRPQDWLYTLAGSLTSGAHRFTNSYLAVSLSAKRVVAHLAR